MSAVEQPAVPEEAIEAAAKVLRCDYATQYDDTNVNWQEFADLAAAALAAAVPVLLEELAGRIEEIRDSHEHFEHCSLTQAAGIVRGFAAEVTQ